MATTPRSPWTWPVVLAVITLVGLLSALLSDGLWDVLSWIALAIPVGVCLWFGLARGRRDGPAAHTDRANLADLDP